MTFFVPTSAYCPATCPPTTVGHSGLIVSAVSALLRRWCCREVCSIRSYTPGLCVCCRDETTASRPNERPCGDTAVLGGDERGAVRTARGFGDLRVYASPSV